MENILYTNIILGAGIAGISAGYHLRLKGEDSVIFEKDNDWGGLCGNFTIGGFRFDRFVHFSFATNEEDKQLFAAFSGMHEHVPYPSNYYHGYWLRHPAQNNLAPLPIKEKVEILNDFVNRPQKEIYEIKNYEEWLRVQYGNYFAEHFPCVYTKKYWGVKACDLETKWVGKRMYVPDLKQVLQGSYETQDECFYFAKKMYYPKKGGFKSILNKCVEGLNIQLNHKIISIDTENKILYVENGKKCNYERLISSLPLPEIIKMIKNVPKNVLLAINRLHWTCGYQVSLGFSRPDVSKYLWFYIYDQDILASRVYSPNLKSHDNVPKGCSSLQAEIFFDCKDDIPSEEMVLQNTITKLIEMGLFEKEDIVVQDIRFEPYANVTFVPTIYDDRKIIIDYLKLQGIECIGRFGKWDYKWTHQAFADGKELV